MLEEQRKGVEGGEGEGVNGLMMVDGVGEGGTGRGRRGRAVPLFHSYLLFFR